MVIKTVPALAGQAVLLIPFFKNFYNAFFVVANAKKALMTDISMKYDTNLDCDKVMQTHHACTYHRYDNRTTVEERGNTIFHRFAFLKNSSKHTFSCLQTQWPNPQEQPKNCNFANAIFLFLKKFNRQIIRYLSYSITIFLLLLFTAANNKAIAQCDNIALGKPATGSSPGWGGTVLGNAIDGNCSSGWNSGWFAPQFIQIDLLSTYTINNINIMFDMTPNGNVNHQILTSPDMVTWTIVDVITGFYSTGQLIERCYSSAPLTNVRGVRINSVSSPSWIAIYELGVYTLSAPTNPTITASGPTTFCQGDSVTLTSSTASAYLWSNGATTQSITVYSSGIYSVTTNQTPSCVQGTLACTICGVETASTTVSVNPNITPTFTAVAPFCLGATLTALPIISNNGITGTWSPALNNSATTIYTFTPTAGQCATTTTLTITLIPNIVISISALQNPICAGDSTTLTAGGATSYLWSNGLGTANPVTVTPASTTIYTVTGTLNGCTDTASIILTVNPVLPTVNLGYDTTLCQGTTLTLDATTSNAIYLWQDNSSNSTFIVAQQGTYWVEVNNSCGITSDTITILFKYCDCNIYIPNAFSPNGDNINDKFFPILHCAYSEYNFLIFNRWGEKIFETNSSTDSWDGNYHGKISPMGVYVYLVTYKSGREDSETNYGSVILIR